MKTEAERSASLADMSEREIVETLAGWMGWRVALPPYLTSRDALAPVLEKLTAEEWGALHSLLWKDYCEQHQDMDGLARNLWGRVVTQYLLTLPPATLAAAVAKAIIEAKGQQ